MHVLVTGGAGYIGSTVAAALEEHGHLPIIVDSLIAGKRRFVYDRPFYEGDVGDQTLLKRVFADYPEIQALVHCAALILVPESVEKPYEYYRENVVKSIDLFRFLTNTDCNAIIFSSSASIYGATQGGDNFQVTEDAPCDPQSPYARTKYIVEMILQDFCRAYNLHGIALRYFNPIGADPQMRSGPYTHHPSHVVEKMLEVALGNEPHFVVTGIDYPTRDGSGIRDYIHVWDIAEAHVAAVQRIQAIMQSAEANDDYCAINLGTEQGVTVRELLTAFNRVLGRPIPTIDAPPRPGDVVGVYASNRRARTLLDWSPHYRLEQALRHGLEWRTARRTLLGY